MSEIIVFDDRNKYLQFKASKLHKLLGYGNEGVCFESDNKAYKFIDNNSRILALQLTAEDIITTSKFNLTSFAFPDEIYVLEGAIKGYRTKLVKNNIFSDKNNPNRLVENVSLLDIDKLLKAYKIMKEDIDFLSKNKICILDLPSNLLFDGENLTGIDTIYYSKVGFEIFEKNRIMLDKSIERQFEYLFKGVSLPSIEDMDIDNYLENIDKLIRLTK